MAASAEEPKGNICSQHDKVKEMFCRTDQQLLCYLCAVDQHKDHDTVSSAAERAQRQEQLPTRRLQLLRTLVQKENYLNRLQYQVKEITRSAKMAVVNSGNSFKAMVVLLEERRSEVERQIRSEEQIQLKLVQELREKAEHDVSELRRNISELETLSQTQSHDQFILHCPLLSTHARSTESKESTDSQIRQSWLQNRPRRYFEDVWAAVREFSSALRLSVTEFKAPEPEPRCREGFLRYARDISLDLNSAHEQLYLSQGNKRVTFISVPQWYPDHPDRFAALQVLSREELTGRCYWELEWSTETGIVIAVSYGDVQRNGDRSGFGHNDRSWALDCHTSGYSFRFKSVQSEVSGPVGSRVGVYLDHSAGALSFYSVQGQTMTLLHKVQTEFTKPLRAGVGLSCFGTAHFPEL